MRVHIAALLTIQTAPTLPFRHLSPPIFLPPHKGTQWLASIRTASSLLYSRYSSLASPPNPSVSVWVRLLMTSGLSLSSRRYAPLYTRPRTISSHTNLRRYHTLVTPHATHTLFERMIPSSRLSPNSQHNTFPSPPLSLPPGPLLPHPSLLRPSLRQHAA